MKGLFSVSLDSKVADTPNVTGFDTRPLVEHFGKDVTWRTVMNADYSELERIKGYGRSTIDAIHRFVSENIEYSFLDFMQDA